MRNSSARVSPACPGSAIEIAVAIAPRKSTPTPRPATTPPPRKSTICGTTAPTATKPSPTAHAVTAIVSCVRSRTDASSSCPAAEEAKIAKTATPASRWSFSPNVPARNVGISELNRPKTANPANAPKAATRKIDRFARGTESFCGR